MMIDEYKLGTFYNHKTKGNEIALHKENCKNLKKVKGCREYYNTLKLYINDKGKQNSDSLGRGKNFLIKEKQ
jgi:SsrA-binding protein